MQETGDYSDYADADPATHRDVKERFFKLRPPEEYVYLAEKWLEYYWPIVEGSVIVLQGARSETRADIAFRDSLYPPAQQ